MFTGETEMNAVRPEANATVYQQFEDVVKGSCIGRTWNAVVEFFTVIVTYIADALSAAWGFLKNVFCPSPVPTPMPQQEAQPVVVPVPLPAGTLGAKLALYRNMPRDNAGFVGKSVEVFEDALRRKEEANIAALPAGAAVPDNQRPLHTFQEEFETLMNLPDIAKATVRGYVFSDSDANGGILTFFTQVVGRRQGEYDPPVQDPDTGQLLHAGGHVMIDVREDRTVRLRELRALFNGLPNAEKEVILDKLDFDGFDRLAVSANGRRVLDGIAEISNHLHQQNPLFAAAMQAVHARKFPPAPG